ncbi:hypothetical protein ACOMHN_031488 [Nucella lapillus]
MTRKLKYIVTEHMTNMSLSFSNAFLYVVVISCFCRGSSSVEHSVFHRFLKFIDDFNRKYENGTAEFERRFENFKTSMERIERLNEVYAAQGQSPVFGVNKFADLSQQEFTAQYLTDLRPRPRRESTVLRFQSEASAPWTETASQALPKKKDWYGVLH